MIIFLGIIFCIVCPFVGMILSSSEEIADYFNCNDKAMTYIFGYIFGALNLFIILLVVAKMGVFIK